jgi:hypothetical protein
LDTTKSKKKGIKFDLDDNPDGEMKAPPRRVVDPVQEQKEANIRRKFMDMFDEAKSKKMEHNMRMTQSELYKKKEVPSYISLQPLDFHSRSATRLKPAKRNS